MSLLRDVIQCNVPQKKAGEQNMKGNHLPVELQNTHPRCLSQAALPDKQPNKEFTFFFPGSVRIPTQRLKMWQVWKKTKDSLLKTKFCSCLKNHTHTQMLFGTCKNFPLQRLLPCHKTCSYRLLTAATRCRPKPRCLLYRITCDFHSPGSDLNLGHKEHWIICQQPHLHSGRLWTCMTNSASVICNDFYLRNAPSPGLFLTLAFPPTTSTSLSRHFFWRQALGGKGGPVGTLLEDSSSNHFTSSPGILLRHLPLAGSDVSNKSNVLRAGLPRPASPQGYYFKCHHNFFNITLLKPSAIENWYTWPSVKLCFEYTKLHPITLLSVCCLSSCIFKTEATAGFMFLWYLLSLQGLRSPSSNRMIHYFKARVVIWKENSP